VGELRESDRGREAELLAVCGESGKKSRHITESELTPDGLDFQHIDPNFEHRGIAHSGQQTCRPSISTISSQNRYCPGRLNKSSHSLYTSIAVMGY
jgi:hypothetical protein